MIISLSANQPFIHLGDVLTENGHYWVGVDISESMLDVAQDRDCEGDVLLSDMGQGMPFIAGTFDGCIRFVSQRYHLLLCLSQVYPL